MIQDMQWQIGPPTLTKLEYFAALIMGHIANSPVTIENKAHWAVTHASALIAELDKVQAQEAKP